MFSNPIFLPTAAMCVAFLLSIFLYPKFIPILRKFKFGQQIRTDGVTQHLSKSGTPTMGGVVIIITFLISSIIFGLKDKYSIVILAVTVGYGLIGFLDDYIKIAKKRSLGLRAYQKIILQFIIFIGFIFFIQTTSDYTKIIIPFLNGKTIDLGILYIPFAFVTMVGTVNGANLTDGIDGLASSVTIFITMFFLILGIGSAHSSSILSGALIGSLMGFLLFNSYPAKIFMGDTGSLALGGFIASAALLQKVPAFILIVAIIYLVESLSTILQVGYFKISKGKRIFKMAPIHHHFELSGYSETQVVTMFTIITIIAVFIGILAFS